MRVLVTGGAGFIGSNLAQRLVDTEGVSAVRVLDDLSTGNHENVRGLDVDFIEASILDMEALGSAMTGVDAVVHLAAIPSVPRSVANPRASHDANTTGTLNVLESAREAGATQVVVASSSSVYGSNPTLPKSEFDWTRPMSPYAVTKMATENYAIAYQHSYGLATLAFRFFNVFGPRQSAGHAYAAVIPKFLEAIMKDEPLVVHGDGLQSRDFTYVGTVVEVITRAVTAGISSVHPVNLAFGTRTTLLELVALLEDLVGRSLPIEFVESRVGDVQASQADPQALLNLLPEVEPTDLRVGLQETLDWFRATADN